MLKAKLALAAVFLLLLSTIKFLDYKRTEATKMVEQQKIELALQVQRAEALEARLIEIFEDAQRFERASVALQNKYSKTQRELTSLRNREATVVAKPTLVALKINKAFDQRQKELACLTGDFTLCSNK